MTRRNKIGWGMAAGADSYEHLGQARDRVLEYARRLGLDPVRSLKLALAALEGASEPSLPAVMAEFHALLRRAGLHPDQASARPAVPSGPPLNRRPLAAEK